MNTKKNILIVDDEASLLEAYKTYAKKVFDKVYSANNCKSALSIINSYPIDCAVLDHRLEDGYGIRLVASIKKLNPTMPIILITGYADKDLAIEAVNQGIFYFIEKPIKKKEFIAILEKSLAYISCLKEKKELEHFYLLTNQTIETLKKKYNLSDREIEVVSCAIHQLKNTTISEKLFITPGTVKRHLHNIFEKLEISSKDSLKELIKELNSRGS